MDNRAHVVELDVREQLRNKIEPFKLIMDTVKQLNPNDTFRLHTTFKPTPLLTLMKTKGYAGKSEKLSPDHWVTTFVPKSRKAELEEAAQAIAAEERHAPPSTGTSTPAPNVYELDNRGLEPPQPMVRTLKALEKAGPGDVVIIHNDRVPVYLIEELVNLGYPYEVDELADGSAIVRIEKR